jgi:hypothetical protein
LADLTARSDRLTARTLPDPPVPTPLSKGGNYFPL